MLAMTLTLPFYYHYWWGPQTKWLHRVFPGGGITELPSPGTSGSLLCEGCPRPIPSGLLWDRLLVILCRPTILLLIDYSWPTFFLSFLFGNNFKFIKMWGKITRFYKRLQKLRPFTQSDLLLFYHICHIVSSLSLFLHTWFFFWSIWGFHISQSFFP